MGAFSLPNQIVFQSPRPLQVFNVVPSISAVTGISPGRYLWRVVIGFHLGPRLLIVATYYHFLLSFVPKVGAAADKDRLAWLLKALFYLQVVEVVGLCGISFIHNREHYRRNIVHFCCYYW